MTKDKLKDDVIRTICFLNSDISNKDRELLIKLFNSIIDYTNNTELEQDINEIEKLANDVRTKHNSLYTDVNNTLKPKINSINDRVTALENASQS